MRIGIDASRANREHKTGVEWYAYYLIQELKKIISIDVEVILYSAEPLKGELAKLPANWTSKVLSWPPKFLWTHFRLSWELLLHKVDVFFIPSYILPVLFRGKGIVTMHDVAYKIFPEAYTLKGRIYLNFFAWWHRLVASKIITISQYSKKDIVKYHGFSPDQISVIPIAYDNDLYRVTTDRSLVRACLQKHKITKPYFFSISRLETKKNTIGMIRAFEKLPEDYQLVLVGKPGCGYSAVKAAIDASPRRKDIIIPGWVENEDIPLLMNGAAAFLFPSFYEGFGIPILEAMACGTPVITSDTTACPETAGDAAMLVDPEDIDMISRQMLKLVKDSAFREVMVEKGLERVKQFSWKKCAAETWEVIKLVCRD